jgi:hypothetical protein
MFGRLADPECAVVMTAVMEADGYSFETDDGHVIQPPARDPIQLEGNLVHARHPDIGPSTPVALWGGEEMDFSYAVSVIWDACELAEARAAPDT